METIKISTKTLPWDVSAARFDILIDFWLEANKPNNLCALSRLIEQR